MLEKFANIIKKNYRNSRKGGEPGSNSVVAVDETLIIYDINGNHQWLLGAIETVTKEVRLELIPNRNTATIKKFFLIILWLVHISPTMGGRDTAF